MREGDSNPIPTYFKLEWNHGLSRLYRDRMVLFISANKQRRIEHENELASKLHFQCEDSASNANEEIDRFPSLLMSDINFELGGRLWDSFRT